MILIPDDPIIRRMERSGETQPGERAMDRRRTGRHTALRMEKRMREQSGQCAGWRRGTRE